jgi:hypothetical protein
VTGLERDGQVSARVVGDARQHLGVHRRHPGRRAPQAVAVGILTHGEEELANRPFGSFGVDLARAAVRAAWRIHVPMLPEPAATTAFDGPAERVASLRTRSRA